MATPNKAVIEKLTRALADEGRIIEAGWVSMKLTTIPEDAPAIQLEEMRNAFFAGAQHLFGSIMTILDSGSEPTAADLRRMTLINTELEQFIEAYKRDKGLSDHGTQG